MQYAMIILVALMSMVVFFPEADATTASLLKATPKERCLASFEGTPNAKQCEYL